MLQILSQMKKKFSILLLLFLVCTFSAKTQQTDKKLQKLIEKEVAGFQGTVGVYVKNLKTGKEVSIHADTIFPTASTIKVPIMVAVFDKIEIGELNYYQPLI